MRRALILLTVLIVLLPAAASAVTPDYRKTDTGTVYESETLRYSIEVGNLNGTKVYVTRIWMLDPGRQIRKATAGWKHHLAKAEDIAKKIPEAALAVNGSGYVSPLYPDIPEDYPGESADYFFTPLGSVTVTDGEVLRCLDGVPYYGLTLEADGLHLYNGADPAEVLARDPIQTWSFYERCPLIVDGVSALDREWDFALRKAARTVIARLPDDSYVILTVTSVHGLPLTDCTDFLLAEFHPVWAYNLDGGPSTGLIRRKHGKRVQKLVYGSKQKVFDIMAFTELADE